MNLSSVLPDSSNDAVLLQRSFRFELRDEAGRIGGNNELIVVRTIWRTEVCENRLQTVQDAVGFSHEGRVAATNVELGLSDWLGEGGESLAAGVTVKIEPKPSFAVAVNREADRAVGDEKERRRETIEMRLEQFLIVFTTRSHRGRALRVGCEREVLAREMAVVNETVGIVVVDASGNALDVDIDVVSEVAECCASLDISLGDVVLDASIHVQVGVDALTERIIRRAVVNVFEEIRCLARDEGFKIGETGFFVDLVRVGGGGDFDDRANGHGMEGFEFSLVGKSEEVVPGSRAVQEKRENFRFVKFSEDEGGRKFADAEDVVEGKTSLVEDVTSVRMSRICRIKHDTKEAHGFVRCMEFDVTASEDMIGEE